MKRQFKVSGMMCTVCSGRVEKAVSSLRGVEFCSVNLLSGILCVEGTLTDEEIIDAVVKAGYKAKAMDSMLQSGKDENLTGGEAKKIKWRL